MPLIPIENGFELRIGGTLLLRHTEAAPCAYIGRGEATMAMHQGNFAISDYLIERVPLAMAEIDGALIRFGVLTLRLEESEGSAILHVVGAAPGLNRLWLRLHAEPGEQAWGCGEQMSHLNLRGRRFRLWTSEPGVGREPGSFITYKAGHAGGDYDSTNAPQPSFLTSRRTFVHLETTAYSVFDFRHDGFHELECWAIPDRLELMVAETLPALVGHVSTRFGRQPPLPEWLMNGAVIGLKSGASGFDRADRIIAAGTAVSAIWCEDWAGIRTTSFGTRLFWDWVWNPARYPDLPARIAALRAQGIRFMAYVSPYLCSDGTLFPEAESLGLFATNAQGGTYLVDFGEFSCGVVDFTRPAARDWFARRIIRGNMLDIGISGWMADFGEYLPIDAILAGGEATLLHNAWPPIWAGVNAQAVAEAGQTGEALFFMRAAFTGSQAHCPILWAGDQCVDFSRHDGLRTVITAALSAGLLGHAYHHSDIGGYTSLFGNVRTGELIMRWAEMAAFTPMMRTHEGNRPGHNLQIDQDETVLAHFARMTQIWRALVPYLRHLTTEARDHGLPAQRPLFLHFESDPACFAIEDQYLYGADLLVAPVHQAAHTTWSLYLPAGARWVHLWSGETHAGGQHLRIPAPLGEPPVFWREGSAFAEVFLAISVMLGRG